MFSLSYPIPAYAFIVPAETDKMIPLTFAGSIEMLSAVGVVKSIHVDSCYDHRIAVITHIGAFLIIDHYCIAVRLMLTGLVKIIQSTACTDIKCCDPVIIAVQYCQLGVVAQIKPCKQVAGTS